MKMFYSKPVADRCLALHVADLNKNHLLAEGTKFQWRWLKKHVPLFAVSIWTCNNSMIIEGNSIKPVKVHLTYTTCNYGGRRPWFICPACGIRVGKLYFLKELFRCRHCHRLTYLSCQSSRNRVMQTLLSSRRIKQKLLHKGLLNSNYRLIARPKGMHFSTYHKLRKDFIRSENCLSQSFYYQIDSIQKKINQG